MKISLTKQSVNILRNILGAPGWATSPLHIFVGGALLSDILPDLDISWALSSEAVSRLTPAEVAEYRKREAAWCDEIIEVEINEKQREAIRLCIQKFAGQLPVNKYTAGLMAEFGFSE